MRFTNQLSDPSILFEMKEKMSENKKLHGRVYYHTTYYIHYVITYALPYNRLINLSWNQTTLIIRSNISANINDSYNRLEIVLVLVVKYIVG